MYGGIRGGVKAGLGPITAGLSGQAAVEAGQGVGAPQPGAPYSMPGVPLVMGSSTPATYQVLLALVLVEAFILLGLRRGFKHHHGG